MDRADVGLGSGNGRATEVGRETTGLECVALAPKERSSLKCAVPPPPPPPPRDTTAAGLCSDDADVDKGEEREEEEVGVDEREVADPDPVAGATDRGGLPGRAGTCGGGADGEGEGGRFFWNSERSPNATV